MRLPDLLTHFPPPDVERAKYLACDLSVIPFDRVPRSFLDFGAGSGSMAAVVASSFPGISGTLVDVMSRMRYLDLVPVGHREKLVFQKWPCRESLAGRKFDLVLSMDVLEHIPDWKGALAEIEQHVADDGYLYIQTPSNYPSPNWPTRAIYINRIKGLFGRHNPANHVRHGLSCKKILDALNDRFDPLVAAESYMVDGTCHCLFKPRTHLLLRKKHLG